MVGLPAEAGNDVAGGGAGGSAGVTGGSAGGAGGAAGGCSAGELEGSVDGGVAGADGAPLPEGAGFIAGAFSSAVTSPTPSRAADACPDSSGASIPGSTGPPLPSPALVPMAGRFAASADSRGAGGGELQPSNASMAHPERTTQLLIFDDMLRSPIRA